MRMTPMRAVLVGWILCAGAAFSLAGVAAAPATAMDGSGRKVYRLGDVEITAWTDVTIGGLEYSTNLYFIAENTGSRTVTLHVPAAETIATPSWAFHFYDFQPPEIELDPGEKRTLEYMISNEGRGQATLRFPFRTEGARASSRTIKVKLLSADSGGFDSLPADGTVSGTVRTSAGEPVAGADVTVYLFSGRNWVHTTTGPDGSFSVSVPTIATLEEALGDRPLPYASLDYFVNVSADGYTFGYADGLEPASARAAQAEIVVNPVSLPEYRQVAEMSSDYEHGFFWVKAGEDGYAAVQGRHPPELHVPGEIVFFDDAGKVRWRHETGDECWGFDVRRGRIAAACHDGSVLLYDEDGGLLWSHDVGTMTRAIGLSPNGKWAFTGPWDVGGQNADGALVTARDGKLVWSWSDEQRWLRHVRFDRRSKLIAAGFSGGQLVLFDHKGKLLWEQRIGEFPMLLEIDKKGNVYAAGKNRELFSYDRNGKLRFRRRIANHVVSAGSSNIDRRGKRIALGTVGGMVFMFDTTGKVLWRRRLPDGNPSQGHNAMHLTANGKYLVAGGTGGSVVLYDRNGTLLWQTKVDAGDPEADPNHSGAIGVYVSEDGKRIVAAFADSTLRVFERQ